MSGPMRPAVFLDKDGTLVEDVPFNVDPARLAFTPNALAGLALLRDAGFALVVVTNQSGLGLGLFSRQAFARLEAALLRRLADAGVPVEAIHVCPHRADESCLCRKPAPGMLLRASRAHGIDLARSWLVGDILDDVEAGRRAGCRTVLLDVGHETVWRRSPFRTPDHHATDLLDAARLIVVAARAGAHAGGDAPRADGVAWRDRAAMSHARLGTA